MPTVILPAGLSPIGLADPAELPPIPAPLAISADGIDERTKDYLTLIVGADPVDDQVYIAMSTLRGSGAAVIDVGQRFQDIRKITEDTALLFEREARTALGRLTANGDISIEKIFTNISSPDHFGEVIVDYINNRLPKPEKRRIKMPLRPEATSS